MSLFVETTSSENPSEKSESTVLTTVSLFFSLHPKFDPAPSTSGATYCFPGIDIGLSNAFVTAI